MGGMVVLSQVLDSIERCVVAATSYQQTPGIITVASVPSSRVDGMFSLELQSRNTGREAERVVLRVAHELTVRFVARVNPAKAPSSYRDALEREERLIRALLVQSAIPSVRTSWTATRRTLTPSREQLVVEVLFSLEHYFPLDDAPTTPGNS